MVKNLLIRPYLRDVFLSKDSGINWIYPRFPILSVKIKFFFCWDSSCSNFFYHKKILLSLTMDECIPWDGGENNNSNSRLQICPQTTFSEQSATDGTNQAGSKYWWVLPGFGG